MKTAKQLLQAYIDGNAQESAALFAENGALELPYLADLGVEPRYEGPKTIGAFLTFLHEKMYPGFKFVDVKIYIDTPDQAFGEYNSPEVRDFRKAGPSALLWPLYSGQRQDRPTSRSAQRACGGRRDVPGRHRRRHQKEVALVAIASLTPKPYSSAARRNQT
jgi:hypothetical protein